jgi:2-desacetyl-2-hydroxyethyl bacteriochlorophyllide A dehydrogenase
LKSGRNEAVTGGAHEKDETMQAVKLTGPKCLDLVDTDAPRPDGENVIIKVSTCGICGSDIHYWESGLDMSGSPGLILGHEFCGTVVEPGSRGDLSEHDRVTVLPLDPCGTCESCAKGHPNLCTKGMKRSIPGNNSPGAYAQLLSVRPDMVRKLPDSISDPEAAMIEPASVALHAIHKAGIKAGDKVLITGGGTIGLLCAAWARISGASFIALTEINANRRAFAQNAGEVDFVFDATDPRLVSTMKRAIQGGFDTAIETSASDEGINTAISALKPRGILVLAGISFHAQAIMTVLLVIKEIEQRSALGYLPKEFDSALDYIANKRLSVDKYISRTICMDEVQDAFECLSSSTSADVKILIRIA